MKFDDDGKGFDFGQWSSSKRGDGLKTKIFVPPEVKVRLFREQSKIIRSARAECMNTTIKYENIDRQLVFGGSMEEQLKAMLLISADLSQDTSQEE